VGPLALRGGLEIRRAGDYEAPDGLRVPASRDEQSVFVSLSGGAGASSWWLTPIVQRGEGLDYPALPMDTERETLHLLTGGWRRARVAGPWSLELGGGLSDVDHRMSNAAKPNRDRLVAATDSLARSAALGLVARRALGVPGDLTFGLELGRQERDAVRERRLADGRTFRDHLWPDVTEERAGVFAEWQRPLARGWNLRLGARADRFRADAAGADGPGLGGRTVRESYARFYGAAAADVSRSDTLWTANAQASWRGGGGLGGYVGAGIVARAPAVTERYFAFAPAPGGFTVGNPSLAAERKREVVAGLSLERPQLFVAADLFHDDFTDYIHQAVVAELDLDGDGVVDTVRGYRNVEATLYGGELALVLRPRDRLRIPLALAWVRGRNDSAGVPLPEIPPLEGRAAVRVALAGPRERWLEVGVRVASRQDRIDPLFGEDATPGFAVWHLRSACALGEHVVLGIGVENLFDRAYHEHLTREAYFAAGDLGPGDEVPAPARHLVVTLRYGR
jgi:iron complex outermembrane receptor protein